MVPGVARVSWAPPPASGRLLVPAAAALVLAVLATLVAWPVARLAVAALAAPWDRPLGLLANSLAAAAASTVLAVALALPLAFITARTTVPGRRLAVLLVRLPLLAPPFLAALALSVLAGRDGALARGLGPGWSIEGLPGLVLAQVATFLPYAWVVLARDLARMDPALEDAAESLGARRLTTLRRITLPRAGPGIASAALLVFVLCLADFGNPFIIAAGYPVLTTAIYAAATSADGLPAAAALSLVLVAPCLAAWLLSRHAVGVAWFGTAGRPARPRERPPGPAGAPLRALSMAVALALGGLYALVPLASVAAVADGGVRLSADNYRVLAAPGALAALGRSLLLAAAAGAGGTLLALGAAWVIQRLRPRPAPLLAFLGLMPVALPGTVIGVGYLLAFGPPPPALAGALGLLAASVVAWKLPAALQAALDALGRAERSMEEAAVSLGAGPWRVFGRVVAPVLAGSAPGLFAYFFVHGMVTVSTVVLLAPPGLDLGTTAILTHVLHGARGVACALATVVVVLTSLAVLLARALAGREQAPVLFP